MFNIISLQWQLWTGRYKHHGNLKEADSVAGLSFGLRCNAEDNLCVPDPANYELAQYVEKKTSDKLPRFLQHEIDDHIHGKYKVALYIDHNKMNKRDYLDTYEVLRQVKIEMKKKKLNKPIIVAQALHVPRVDAVARKMGLETIVPKGLPKVWDKQSNQLWTRGRLFWLFRESLAIFVYKLKGFI